MSRQRHKLAMYAQAMFDGLTLRNAAKCCGITLSTSFRWRHKLLSMPERHKAKTLTGIVEVDETFSANRSRASEPLRAENRGSMGGDGKVNP